MNNPFNLSRGRNPYGGSDSHRSIEQTTRHRTDNRTFTRNSYQDAKKSNPSATEVDEGGWMLTYADTMTLLLTFFVLMFSLSDINISKFEEFKSAISGELLKKEPPPRPFDEMKEALEELIVENRLEDAVHVTSDPLGIQIELASASLYELGSAELRQNIKPVLKSVSTVIAQLDMTQFVIEVQGHTDDIPIRSAKYESNWELSAHRATNMVRLFIDNGLPAEKLKAAGFADSRPKVPNRDVLGNPIPQNQAENRRAVITVRRG